MSTKKYYSAMRKKEILPFVTTRMDLEGIMLSEINQTKKTKYCMVSLTRGILKKKSNFSACQEVGRGENRERLVKGYKLSALR